ncbi:NADP oxidoreductase coenzyme F420-dependent [Pedobacter ginsengisoli]|uniref:NADP oxidoreductase coenzyme F420-dependent n=1 Tax=Pedobacter ginsengisoli TaxID=363852 RepID=A0A2D1U9D1_9SPHI|nr:NAD(P)-binding domain-containing protein [Pedobacter ginsengisoli]ATP58225.1 NADP oxidoreductase coenzyme F420-dependent [Pedobacter ginsengisoli]
MNTANQKTKVAVIGLGNIGKAIATNLVKGNHPVILSSREIEKANYLAEELGALATAEEISSAIRNADVVIPAIYFDKIKEFLGQYATELKGKIIVDVSNPIAPDANGGFKKIIDKAASAGQILLALVPKDASFVKAFGTLGAATLLEDSFTGPEKKVLFYASDNTNSNKQIEELITDSGFEPLHIGGTNQSIRIEVFGDLHEFGALGKAVTFEEAKIILNQHKN